MPRHTFATLYRFLSAFIAVCLLSADLASAAALVDFQGPEPIGTPVTVVVPPAAEQALFRTTVTLRQPRDLSRVREMGAVVLEADETSALLLVTADQLADLARLRFQPTASDELGALAQAAGPGYEWLRAELRPTLERAAVVRGLSSVVGEETADDGRQTTAAAAELATLLASVTVGQRAAIASLAATDSDNDGLTDTQEGWWCTNPAAANSDGTGANDGAEVAALLNFTLSRAVRWGHGAPFGPPAAWPDFNGSDGNPNTPACNDGDYDTIPDFAEVYMVGSRVPEETTDLDKFDDGQELFGTTFCPGGTASCNYGSYPRIEYWNHIKASMPTWVQPPGDNLFVAAFPEPKVSVVPGSWTIQTVTTITTSEGTMTETSNSYATTVTNGQSSSIADTKTWNNWQEVSRSVERPLQRASTLGEATPSGRGDCADTDLICQMKGAGKFILSAIGTVGYAGLCNKYFNLNAETQYGSPNRGTICTKENAEWLSTARQDGWNEMMLGDEYNWPKSWTKHIDGFVDAVTDTEEKRVVPLEQDFDTQALARSLNGIQTALNQQGQLVAKAMYDVSYQISRPRVTETKSSGTSWGGAQTTTHEQYEEHAITNGQQFTTGQNWSTAWSVESDHAANLTFTYRVDNTGTEYFRELTGLAFNIYLGDDATPIITYEASQQIGPITNFFPADSPVQRTSTAIPLTLEQMKRIDLGEKLTIVVEDFSYGADENFYQDAINGGVEVLIEDGAADNDETVDRYVIPTWGVESVQDVLTRAFPATEDAQGNLIALKTAEFNGTQPPVWNEYVLSDIAWWNVYQSCSTDCANVGATPLQEQMAQAGSSILFRFNRDSDRDGYKDSVEWRYGTDRNDPASHPTPEMLAGYTLTRSGNQVTGLLKLLNNGTFDAYGIDAVVYAPDDSITITNNTVGGNGRVRSGDSVAVGALIQPPNLSAWGTSTAKVYAQGNYTGAADRVYTFTVQNAGVVGQGNTSLTWSDGTGMTPQVLQVGATYHAPLPLPVANGLEVGLDSGMLAAGARFTVQTLIPRDTFKFTINREPYTPPVVVISYSDPQGSHRFITPAQLGSLEDDLNAHSGKMLPDVGLSISANGPFNASGNNTTDFILYSPDAKPITGAKLYLDFVSDGKLVKEIVQTFDQQPGPTVRAATWSAADFNADYNPDGDNILLAFWTDAQDNIIDSAARPFNTLQDDPTAVLVLDSADLTWNFGAAEQGTLLRKPILLGNTGRQALLARIGTNANIKLDGPSGPVGPGGVGLYTLNLDTTGLPAGPYNAMLPIRTSDPANPTATLTIAGTIQIGTADTGAGAEQRPLDWLATITGAHNQGEWVTYSHTLGPEPQSLHPARVFSQDYATYWGNGRAATDVLANGNSVPYFGTGANGDLLITTTTNGDYRANPLAAGVSAGARQLAVAYANYFSPGMEVLIIQMQGIGAGQYEFGTVESTNADGTIITLQNGLTQTYNTGGTNRAQVIFVPQYRNVTIASGGVYMSPRWDGSTGGVLPFRVSGTLTVEAGGKIDASYAGFRGGPKERTIGYQGESITGTQERSIYASGSGGGAGQEGSGGGAGHGTAGGRGWVSADRGGQQLGGYGGSSIGSPEMTQIFMGGGGGGGSYHTNNPDCSNGHAGGGIIIALANQVNLNGAISANGESAWQNQSYCVSGGAGAGGSVLLKVDGGSLGANLIEAKGGASYPTSGSSTARAGTGGDGRIRIEYCDVPPFGSTYPSASLAKVTCYLAEQLEISPFDQGRLNLPESFTDLRAYRIQYARRLVHTAAGEQTAALRVPAGVFNSATLHALVSGVGSGDVTLKLDMGNDGAWDWEATQNVTNAIDLTSPSLAAAFNAYWTTHDAPSSGNVDVPVRVYLSKPGQVLLTDLQMTGGGSSLRYVRLPAGSYGSVALDLTVGGSGSGALTLAADVGDDGTVDWSTSGSGPFPRALTTGDLSAAVNAYLAGKSGDVDVPVRLTYTPFNGVSITRAVTSAATLPDGSITNADVTLSQTNLTEGDTTTVNATVRGSATIDGVTVGFFASLPNGLDWYLGSQYLPSVSPSGTATSLVWDTTGFTGATTVKVIIDPTNTLAETNEANNQGTKSATVKTRPNLRVTAIAPATSFPVSGETLTVNVTVQNNGQSPSAAAVCSLYLGNPDSGGTLIGSQACGPLGANTSLDYTYTWTPGAVGPARLFARADSGNALDEPDEFDNDRWLDLDVADPGPMPPLPPSNPSPADAATNVPVAANLSWTSGDPNPGNTVTYKVYQDTFNPPTTLKITQATITTYDPPGDLLQCTTYYWQIVATDNTSRTTTGPVWRFSTYCPANTAPTAPTNPNPANGATGVSKAVGQVCWAASSDADSDLVTYDVAFGTSNPPSSVATGQSGTCYNTGALAGHTTYYWKVTAKDNRGGSTPGPVWSFTTANTAPTTPSNPNPANGATNVPVNTQVCWATSSDGDNDALTYEVRFGTSNTPGTVVASQSATCYDPPGDLSTGTLHYWQIIAKDAFGGSTAGPVWSFTTVNTATTWTPATIGAGTGRVVENGGQVIVTGGGGDIVGTCDVFEYGYRTGMGDMEIVARASNWNPGSSTKGKAGLMFRASAAPCVPHVTVHVTTRLGAYDGVKQKVRSVSNGTTANLDGSSAAPPVWLKLRKVGTSITSYYSTDGVNWTQIGTGTTLDLGTEFLYGFAVSADVEGTVTFDNITVRSLTNSPPNPPSTPSPANGATGVATSTQVCWSGGDPNGDALTYEVRFGTSNTPGTVITSQSATCYDPPGDLAASTTYYWQIIAKDAFGGSTAGPVWSFTTAGGPTAPGVFFISPSTIATIGGIPSTPADILRYTKSSNTWTMVYDGSERGTPKNIGAFALLDDGRLLLVFSANQVIAGLGTATPRDVVAFTPTNPGSYPLGGGTYSWYLRGNAASVGLTTTGENIDALDVVGDRVFISVTGAASVPAGSGTVLKAADEDVMAYNLTNSRWESALVIDGSLMTGMAVEDVSGVWDDPLTGDFYITIVGAFNLGGVAGNGKTIIKLTPNASASRFTPTTVAWLAAGATFPSNLDGLELAR